MIFQSVINFSLFQNTWRV